MTREFIILPEFEKRWKRFELFDDDLRKLQEYLCINPEAGNLIQKTGGLRKLRWALSGKGKSSGIRVLYVDLASFEKLGNLSKY